MKLLKRIFGGGSTDSGTESDFFDVHHAKTMDALQLPRGTPAGAVELAEPIRSSTSTIRTCSGVIR
jgi:hypothetical protein